MKPLAGYALGESQSPNLMFGDYVVGDRNPRTGWAMSSTVGAFPWYYTVTPSGELLQGGNVFELCTAANLAWDWNMTAVHQIATVGHTLGLHTLHSRIFRLTSHTRVALVGGDAVLQSTDSLAGWTWDAVDLDRGFRTLTEAFEACLEGASDPILSLSAGFDSRLLLALCLHFGCSPSIANMGGPQATDTKIAMALARRVGLAVERVDIAAGEYVRHGEQISRTTSGVKTAADWHTWLYSKAIGETSRIHLVGSNGEFARTFYSDVLTRSNIFRSSGRRGASAYFALKALNRWRKYPRRLAGPLSASASVRLPAEEYPRSALASLDTFYAIERVRHFIGSGLACYAQFNRPRSPFLDRRWMMATAALHRSWKEGNRYHRAAIQELHPSLLEIPFNQDPDGGTAVSYSPFEQLVGSRDVEELLVESDPLDFLLERKARIATLREGHGHKASVVSLLLTLHFASVNARRASA